MSLRRRNAQMVSTAGGKCGCVAAAIIGLIAPSLFGLIAGSYAGCSFEIACNSYAPLIGFLVGVAFTLAAGFGVRFIVDRL